MKIKRPSENTVHVAQYDNLSACHVAADDYEPFDGPMGNRLTGGPVPCLACTSRLWPRRR